jgi:hypothetical protein
MQDGGGAVNLKVAFGTSIIIPYRFILAFCVFLIFLGVRQLIYRDDEPLTADGRRPANHRSLVIFDLRVTAFPLRVALDTRPDTPYYVAEAAA